MDRMKPQISLHYVINAMILLKNLNYGVKKKSMDIFQRVIIGGIEKKILGLSGNNGYMGDITDLQMGDK